MAGNEVGLGVFKKKIILIYKALITTAGISHYTNINLKHQAQ